MKSAAAVKCLAVLSLLLPMGASAQDERCATSLREAGLLLGRLVLPRTWQETTMRDGKPLTLRLDERGGVLHMEFVKAGEGLWATGPARICRSAGVVAARLSATELTVGPAANWLVRQLMRHDATFGLGMLAEGRLRVSGAGWSGDFMPAAGHAPDQ